MRGRFARVEAAGQELAGGLMPAAFNVEVYPTAAAASTTLCVACRWGSVRALGSARGGTGPPGGLVEVLGLAVARVAAGNRVGVRKAGSPVCWSALELLPVAAVCVLGAVAGQPLGKFGIEGVGQIGDIA
jgi:hypothetical protein